MIATLIKRVTLSTIALLVVMTGSAIEDPNAKKNKKPHRSPQAANAADCAPPAGLEYLNINNVNCIIETGGIMWQDRPNNAAGYVVPEGSGHTAIYSGSLWMGGIDNSNNLKIAAVTFRNGTSDFWTGPLTTDNTAEITPEVCNQYDKMWYIRKQDVIRYIAWYACINSEEGCPPEFDGYRPPTDLLEWPAHGDLALNQPHYLAPFKDLNENTFYEPELGEFPYYDLNNEIDCRAVRDIRLFGDETYWWIFNDKGNIHTETNGQSIGMEIHAQAFAFTSNDEINDMTFYNYELINRSTFELKETYFAQWVDADLGCSDDDFVGCDVGRGLGFCYNGDDFDEDCRGILGYGATPPAIGVDFFEGPYQDNDSTNNEYGIGPGQALNGIGYANDPRDGDDPDLIIDNERFGMRRFIYYNRSNDPNGDPQTALEHYNYMKSIWRDGGKMVYGGNGRAIDPGATQIEADFMFPGASDPLNWGTRGEDPGFEWDEIQAGNTPFDRRFLQSAGPFTLKPGAVNDITVGVVYARATAGSAYESVRALVIADTKAQQLFDNCFDVLDGPDAPDLGGVELDREIILHLSNRKGLSNNFKEYPGDYVETDPFIVSPEGENYDDIYRFQGYQIYQVSNPDVSINELDDISKARLAFQCDIKDDVGDLTNFVFNEEVGASEPLPMVTDAANDGIKTTFRVTQDLFAVEDRRLVNFKTYYFIAIAYAHNNFKEYKQDDPDNYDGQKEPYLPSRKGATSDIREVGFTPHPQGPRRNGTVMYSEYGDQPSITRIEGTGNGGIYLDLTDESREDILENSFTPLRVFPTYKPGSGPLDVKVVDPTSVPSGQFTIKMVDKNGEFHWVLIRDGDNTNDPSFNDPVESESSISVSNEQIIDKWGISVNFSDVPNPGELLHGGILDETDQLYTNGFIGSSMTFADSSKIWLSGIPDVSGADDQNWIRSGTNSDAEPYDSYSITIDGEVAYKDPFGKHEAYVGGTWAPFPLTACTETNLVEDITCLHAPGPWMDSETNLAAHKIARLQDVPSVDIIITSNRELWTRCPVIELQEEVQKCVNEINETIYHESVKNFLRMSPSVDKDGNPDGTGNGMGWFPGYAINVETGERLNMAFGEDSWLGADNGADMIWNPTSTLEGGFVPGDNQRNREKVWGGKHYIYVFGNSDHFIDRAPNVAVKMPTYDEGATLKEGFRKSNAPLNPTIQREIAVRNMWGTCVWAGIPILLPQHDLLETDVKISLRVDRSYEEYDTDTIANNGLPMYTWNMGAMQTIIGDNTMAKAALESIRVVPNPYYAFAEHYEQGQLDNFVKITNLPEQCQVTIYNVSGTRIRHFDKSDPSSEILWDLKNQDNVLIAGGVYLIHVNADGVGEKIVKWFGVLRPVDLQGF